MLWRAGAACDVRLAGLRWSSSPGSNSDVTALARMERSTERSADSHAVVQSGVDHAVVRRSLIAQGGSPSSKRASKSRATVHGPDAALQALINSP